MSRSAFTAIFVALVSGLLYLATHGGKTPVPEPFVPSLPKLPDTKPLKKPLFPWKRGEELSDAPETP